MLIFNCDNGTRGHCSGQRKYTKLSSLQKVLLDSTELDPLQILVQLILQKLFEARSSVYVADEETEIQKIFPTSYSVCQTLKCVVFFVTKVLKKNWLNLKSITLSNGRREFQPKRIKGLDCWLSQWQSQEQNPQSVA